MLKDNARLKKIIGFDYNALSLPVLAGYLALSIVFPDLGISAILGALLLCVWTGVCLLSFIFIKKWKFEETKKEHLFLLIFTLVVIINVLRNFSLDRTLIYYVILLLVGNVLFWIRSPLSKRSIKITRYILIITALFFSIVNIVNIYFPDAVKWICSTLLSDVSQKYNEKGMRDGYGFAFGADIGRTAHMIGLGLTIVWFDFTKKNWKTHLLMIFVLAFGLFAVQRRGEMLIWLIAIFCTTVIRLIKSQKFEFLRKQQFVRSIVCALCVVIAFGVFNFSVTNSRFSVDSYIPPNSSSSETGDLGDSSELPPDLEFDVEEFSNGRLLLWRLAWEKFLEKPIFGHGWRYFSEIGFEETGNINAINVHNIYIQLLCETGVVGFIAVGGSFLGLFLLLFKKLFREQSGKRLNEYLSGLCIFLAMLGMGVVDNSLFIFYWIQTFQIMLLLVFTKGIKEEVKSVEIIE